VHDASVRINVHAFRQCGYCDLFYLISNVKINLIAIDTSINYGTISKQLADYRIPLAYLFLLGDIICYRQCALPLLLCLVNYALTNACLRIVSRQGDLLL
jgi:hypothetical protein